ncbi:tail fiber domain-containing protein [bacterium]|nr:tail fiber domain-containing protein [bacterium]
MASSINASTSGAGGLITTADNTGILNLQTASTTAVTVDASQNVGIGTTSPDTKLSVYASGGTSQFRVGNNTNYYWDISRDNATTGALTFKNYNADTLTERMRITSSGQLLLSSNPSQLWFGDTSTGSFLQGTNTGGYLVFGTSGTEYMRLAGNNLCIRQTSNSGGEVLGINGNGDTQIGLYCSTSSLYTQINFRNSNGVVGTVRTTGTSTQFNTSSDYRLKENVAPMTGALDKVMQLNPVTFTWKTDGLPGQGFIAHELQAIVPDAVGGEKDATRVIKKENEDGTIIEETVPDYQGVDASFLVATLTAAIQEQQTIINDLKARIETLEAK